MVLYFTCYPQTKCGIAPSLAKFYRDNLRGYGDSFDLVELTIKNSKREIKDMVQLMNKDFKKFYVAGHDRGEELHIEWRF